MLMFLAIALLVLWVLGAFVFKIAGAIIHLLLIVAAVVIVLRLLRGRKPI